ncbi:hypothetical protein LJR219_004533 [Phenylobacterium sp. LjRoot219]|uniref:hypothetical protein n=1 Tax=Phenylobacterium sp. LjRoot219 TaxID=3342283 RepID=UPI003ED10D15
MLAEAVEAQPVRPPVTVAPAALTVSHRAFAWCIVVHDVPPSNWPVQQPAAWAKFAASDRRRLLRHFVKLIFEMEAID